VFFREHRICTAIYAHGAPQVGIHGLVANGRQVDRTLSTDLHERYSPLLILMDIPAWTPHPAVSPVSIAVIAKPATNPECKQCFELGICLEFDSSLSCSASP
jgi:hypothetical protein